MYNPNAAKTTIFKCLQLVFLPIGTLEDFDSYMKFAMYVCV